MKKRIYLLLVCCVLMCGALTGCCGESHASVNDSEIEGEYEYFHYTDALKEVFKPVPGMRCVVYNTDTKVMFYMFDFVGIEMGFGYFGEYINENGRNCRYVNNEIVEIIVEDTKN